MKIEIIAVARAKKSPHLDLIQEYQKRIRWHLKIYEIDSKITNPKQAQLDEERKILSFVDPSSYLIVMDERGDSIGSINFAKHIEKQQNNAIDKIQFIIGGADGVTDQIRGKSNFLLSFGKMTWPHMLARVMLLEQIYRAQQILAGHPYHRE